MLTQSEPHSLRIREGWFSIGASLVAQMVKNLPTMWETWVQSLHWDNPLERAWQPTPVFFPGESQERGSLVGCHLWGRTESNPTEVT